MSFRKNLLAGDIRECSCYAGIRDACAQSIAHHVAMLRAMINDVLREHPVTDMHAESLAIYIQAVLQGAFIMAKAKQDVAAARDSVDHLYRHVELLLGQSTTGRKRKK